MSKELLKLALSNPGLVRKKLAWAKKKAAMEKPFKTEYSLVKQANYLKILKDISKQQELEKALKVGLGTVGAGAGGLGSYGLIHSIAPGGFTRHAIMDTTPIIGGGMALGALASAYAGEGIGKGINFIRNPKAYKARNTMTEALSNLTKTSSLSRAAKGAIGLPLGVMGAAAIHPELFGVLPSSLGGHLSDTIGSNILNSLDNLAKPLLGSSSHQLANVGTSLAGLGALGAGAGKLSEKVIPLAAKSSNKIIPPAKKSIMDNPTARKAALAAALFPWSLAIGGGAYLLGKNDSDS